MRITAVASQVVFCLLTFPIYSPHISQNDPLKCMSSDVLPCLNNIHWISISLGVKAKVLPKAHTTLHNLHPPPCYLSDLNSYNSPFHSSPVNSGLFSVHRNARHAVRAFGLAGSFAWSASPPRYPHGLVSLPSGVCHLISESFPGYSSNNCTPSPC